MEDDFTLPAGKPFTKVFETALGQVSATLEPNDDGNASVVFRGWTDEGFGEVALGVEGRRSPATDAAFVEIFKELDIEKVTKAWVTALS